jgi:hypothetical protein
MTYQVDLTESLNWNRLGTWNLTAQLGQDGRYQPIPPVSAVAPSPMILVASESVNARPSWRIGGWVQPAITVNPGSTASFINLGVLPQSVIPLDRYSLVCSPQFQGLFQYAYTFYPANWFRSIKIEAWWYDGPVITDEIAKLDQIISELNSV